MTTDPSIQPAPPSVDDGIHSVLSSAKEKAVDRLEHWEDCVRRHPVQSVLGAVAAGVILHRLPVKAILIAKVRLISALAPPALLAYGAAKLCEILQQKGAKAAHPAPAVPAESPREETF